MDKRVLKVDCPRKPQIDHCALPQGGYSITVNGRSYLLEVDDAELEGLLIRPQEIPRYIEDGIIDCGLTGYDWLLLRANLVQIAELVYAKVGFAGAHRLRVPRTTDQDVTARRASALPPVMWT